MRRREILSVLGYFEELDDPRVEGRTAHRLIDILTLALLAVICGADTWTAVVAYGRSKEAWLKTFLELPHGIPSHDTFGRVFALIDPEKLQACYRQWIARLPKRSKERLVAIDGKRLNGSSQKNAHRKARHLVSAWCVEEHLVLGQVATAEESNEIEAVPELLELLDLKDTVVTLDAMGCQREIARKILEKGGDYLLAVKGNQPQLYEDLSLYFQNPADRAMAITTQETLEKGHGRVEERRHDVSGDVGWLQAQGRWPQVRCIGRVQAKRTVDGHTSEETRYYLGSFHCSAERLGQLVRGHWSIENQLHWSLDVSFQEDANRTRKDHGPENLALLRRWALYLLKQETSVKRSLVAKRLSAGWDNDYLCKVMGMV